ncbi:response regulator transcription factor [Acidisoma cladoniae]|jgi:DNA-binding response OmpR family regulator|uniref:response regulator transcription factor n=1 Tax=Acidisoma cladoniae TaxID=3040935 RepID=UPI00254A4B28|nr:response regulator [Acidisoma sp. PAMC 29798]
MCILLVEDEPLIRSIMADEFLDAGFRVIEAQDGDEALAILADPPTRLTLLVTDINMPGEADGMAVAARLRRDCVSVPIIFTTGHPESLDRLRAMGGAEHIIPKPYSPAKLVALARQLTGHAA